MRTCLAPLALLSWACSAQVNPSAAILERVTFLGAAELPADASDLSGLGEAIAGAQIPQNRLGSLGSALAYTGTDNLYLALCDRGPKDGALGFFPRFHTLALIADSSPGALRVELRHTTLLHDRAGRFSGLSSAFDASQPASGRRMDPEGLRVSPALSVFTSEEYGPWIDEWTAAGEHLRRIALPEKFYVAKLAAKAGDEMPPNNNSGRQSNRAMEGLARSPDGTRLFALMQGPLIQDLEREKKGIGTGVRLVELDLGSGKTREFLYLLDDTANGLNEILAINAQSFLVLERDGRQGSEAQCKRLYRVDLADASDVSAFDSLHADDLPDEVRPLMKQLFLDFLDPRFALAGKAMPEKIEGLSFGPDLADGRRLLLVSIDNDFRPEVPNTFWAFAVGRELLPGFEPEAFDGPWKMREASK